MEQLNTNNNHDIWHFILIHKHTSISDVYENKE